MALDTAALEVASQPSVANVGMPVEGGCDSDNICAHSRLEELVQQQNQIMQRQLDLAEKNSKPPDNFIRHFSKPGDFLTTVDPCVRPVFKEWQRDFRRKLSDYVTQSIVYSESQDVLAKQSLMTPFEEEASKRWSWPGFYHSVASPILEVDPLLPNGTPVGMIRADDMPAGAQQSSRSISLAYSIETAYAELRRRHASELQAFVLAHQKACMQKIIDELALPNQLQTLQNKVETWAAEHDGFYHPGTKELWATQVESFVNLTYRQFMPEAEKKVRQGKKDYSMKLAMLIRIACLVTILLAVTTMSHELLTRFFASFFALVCGMSLIWEDLVVGSLRILFGETVRRLRLHGPASQPVPSGTLYAAADIHKVAWLTCEARNSRGDKL